MIAAAAAVIGIGSAAASIKIVPKTSSGQSAPKNQGQSAPEKPPPFLPAEEARLPPIPSAEEIDAALVRLTARTLPNLPLDIYRFDEAKRRDCDEQRGSEPMVRALLVASDESSDVAA